MVAFAFRVKVVPSTITVSFVGLILLIACWLIVSSGNTYMYEVTYRFPLIYKVASYPGSHDTWGPPRPPLKQACVHPELPLFHPDINKHLRNATPIECGEEVDWVYTKQGRIYLTEKAVRKHGEITCEYFPISFGKDDNTPNIGSSVLFTNGSAMVSDYFEVKCEGRDKKKYHNFHVGIKPKRLHNEKLPDDHIDVSVVMLGLDSLSRAMWQRVLPKTHKFFTETMGAIVLKGYNIVGDGTPQQLIPILTGYEESEMPETRTGRPGADYMDRVFPFIWKDYEKLGYKTLWAEDEPTIATFNMRLMGFNKQPTTHYLRPFFLKAQDSYSEWKEYCIGARPRHMFLPRYLKDFMSAYGGKRQFGFAFYTEISHQSNSKMNAADSDFLQLLKDLHLSEELNNTIFILMSDHGARFSSLRETEQGKLEERMPYFGVRFPQWFSRKYPREMENFKTNVHRLTTPFDIHATFEDLVKHTDPDIGDLQQRGISLFKEIPPERTCSDAGVDAHWCACMKWEHISQQSPETLAAVGHMVTIINSMTEEFRSKCKPLKLKSIETSYLYKTNEAMLKFKKSLDWDGRVPDLKDTMTGSGTTYYHMTFIMEPGFGLFEATLKKSPNEGFLADAKDISRLNAYGDVPKCIAKKAPHLRAYCVCP